MLYRLWNFCIPSLDNRSQFRLRLYSTGKWETEQQEELRVSRIQALNASAKVGRQTPLFMRWNTQGSTGDICASSAWQSEHTFDPQVKHMCHHCDSQKTPLIHGWNTCVISVTVRTHLWSTGETPVTLAWQSEHLWSQGETSESSVWKYENTIVLKLKHLQHLCGNRKISILQSKI